MHHDRDEWTHLGWSVTACRPRAVVIRVVLSRLIFECLIALSVTFMGGWLEQVSGFSQSARIVTLGVASSLIMPGESLWRRAAYEMQTPLAASLSFSPFANVSIPSGTALAYAGVFFVAVITAGVVHFQERDL
jgi:hypothetical protein